MQRRTGKTEQQYLEAYFNDERLNGRLSELQDNYEKAGFREERKRIRASQNVVDLEDISEEEYNRLAARTQELRGLRSSNPEEFQKIFSDLNVAIPNTNESVAYAVHSGAPELKGGAINPSSAVGQQASAAGDIGAGNTVGANQFKYNQAKKILEEKADHIPRITEARDRYIKTGTLPDELKYLELDYKAQLDPVTGLIPKRSQEDIIKAVDKEIFNFSNIQRKLNLATDEVKMVSAAPASAGLHRGYFGRHIWGHADRPWTHDSSIEEEMKIKSNPSVHKYKSIRETSEFASDLDASTGGRGTMWVAAGVKDANIDSSGLLAFDAGETPIISKIKPITGLSADIREVDRAAAIDLGFIEKTLKEHSAKVAAGEIPISTLFDEGTTEASAAIRYSTNEAQVAGRVASNIPPIPALEESLEAVQKALPRGSATRELLSASSEAARAVAKGVEGAGHLRATGAAMALLKGRL